MTNDIDLVTPCGMDRLVCSSYSIKNDLEDKGIRMPYCPAGISMDIRFPVFLP